MTYDWTQVNETPCEPTPAEVDAGRKLCRQLDAKWWHDGYAAYQAGEPMQRWWSPAHVAGYRQAEADAVEAVLEESLCKPGLDLADDYAPEPGEYMAWPLWEHEDLPLWTAGEGA